VLYLKCDNDTVSGIAVLDSTAIPELHMKRQSTPAIWSRVVAFQSPIQCTRSTYCPRVTVVELSPLPFLSTVIRCQVSTALAIETVSLIFVV